MVFVLIIHNASVYDKYILFDLFVYPKIANISNCMHTCLLWLMFIYILVSPKGGLWYI